MIEVIDPATGRKYPSLSAAAKTIGISHGALHYRLKKDPELAFFTGRLWWVFSKDHTGQEFPNIAEMAKAWGLKPKLVRDRLRMGWTVEKALLTPPQKRGNRK